MNPKKVEVTPLQLGQILFVCALKEYEELKDNKKFLKSMELRKSSNQHHFFQEIIVINMFALAQSIQSAFKDQELEYLILDHMNETYFSYLQTELKLEVSIINEHKQHLVLRFQEYNNALSEKRGPNILWPLACHMINNLRKEDVKDPFAILKLISHYSYLIQYFSMVIVNYKIIH